MICVNGVQECGGCMQCRGPFTWPEESREGGWERVPEQTISARAEPHAWQLRQLLKRLDELRGEVERAERSLEALAEASTRASSRLNPVWYGRTHGESRIERAVIGGLDLEREIQALNAEKEGLLQKVAPLVERMPAGTRRAIVKLRFIDGMSCAAITWRLHYSRSYVYKALAEGIGQMALLLGAKNPSTAEPPQEGTGVDTQKQNQQV